MTDDELNEIVYTDPRRAFDLIQGFLEPTDEMIEAGLGAYQESLAITDWPHSHCMEMAYTAMVSVVLNERNQATGNIQNGNDHTGNVETEQHWEDYKNKQGVYADEPKTVRNTEAD